MVVNKKHELQYIKLGQLTNVNNTQVGFVLKTEVFDSLKEINHVVNKLIKVKGYVKHDKILLSKHNDIKVVIKITD